MSVPLQHIGRPQSFAPEPLVEPEDPQSTTRRVNRIAGIALVSIGALVSVASVALPTITDIQGELGGTIMIGGFLLGVCILGCGTSKWLSATDCCPSSANNYPQSYEDPGMTV